MSIQARLLALVDFSRIVEREFAALLTAAERSAAGTPEAWAAKDLVAHVAEWRRRGADDLRAARQGQALSEVSEFEAANREIFEEHRRLSWDEVASLSTHAWDDFRLALAAVPDEVLLSTAASPGGRRPLWRRVAIDAANHPVLHFAEHVHRTGRADAARGWMEAISPKLFDLDPAHEWQGVVHYNLACHRAQTGQTDPALDSLEAAVGLRPDLGPWAKQDADLKPLWGLPRFQAITG